MRLSVAILAVSVSAIAAADARAQPGNPRDPDAREIAAYRLTADAMGRVMRVTHAMVEALKQDPRVQERIRLEAELGALEKKEEPTAADTARIEELLARRESLEDIQPAALTQPGTLAGMEAAIKDYPLLSGPLTKEGMTPREYAKFFLALIHASLAASLQKAGMLKDLPPDVNHDNVQFVLDHQDELHRIQQEFESLGGGA